MAFNRIYHYDQPESFANHLERFQIWLDGKGTRTAEQKRGLLLDTLDDATVESLKEWIAPATLREVTYDQIVLKLDEKITAALNWLVHYSAFVRRTQRKEKTGTSFLRDLKKLATPCGFNTVTNLSLIHI